MRARSDTLEGDLGQKTKTSLLWEDKDIGAKGMK